MPLSVVLQGIDRTRRLDQAFPSKTPLEHLLPFGDFSFPMLGFIDPYGDTLFSGVQMQLFIPEWDRVMQNVTDRDDVEFLSKVRQMAKRCMKHPHTFLRFVGD
jgi:hypothetical protein